jgi:hypothetical protein
MKTNLKRLLYKSLINSEFLITSNENISNNHYTVKNQSKLNRNFFFFTLEPVYVLKVIKQFLKILIFLKNKKSTLYFIIEDNQQFDIIKYLIQIPLKKKSNLEIIIENSFNFKISNFSNIQFLICFNSKKFIGKPNFIKKIVRSRIFLIFKVNSILETDTAGIYKLFNSISDFKKVIFLASLIKRIFLPLKK